MKTKILNVLRECPNGMRLREIAAYIHCSPFALLNPIDELLKAGLVCGRPNEDHANSEYYIIWSVAEVR